MLVKKTLPLLFVGIVSVVATDKLAAQTPTVTWGANGYINGQSTGIDDHYHEESDVLKVQGIVSVATDGGESADITFRYRWDDEAWEEDAHTDVSFVGHNFWEEINPSHFEDTGKHVFEVEILVDGVVVDSMEYYFYCGRHPKGTR